MQTAKVLGTTHATTKHKSLEGRRLIIAQPLLASGESDGAPMIVVDPLGARPGDFVMLTSDSLQMRSIVSDPNTPARWSVLGILDQTPTF